MVQPGLVVAGSVLALVGAFFLTLAPHWFPIALLAVGLVTLAAGLRGARKAAPAAAPAPGGLREQLLELDRLLADGILSPAEHGRKRRQLLDGWGGAEPPQP